MTAAPRRIVLASPIEPSGASWLINCLLELGIRVDHKPAVERIWRGRARDPSRFWVREGDLWRPHPQAAVMGKWMPALTLRDAFAFRDNVVVEYLQELPRPEHLGRDAALFLRDPRDAIYSMYRLRRARLDFGEFCAMPHPVTLLPIPADWRLYIESWMELAGPRVFRFEDYKRDASGLLARILAALDLPHEAAEVARAAEASSFARAREGEARYRAAHPGDDEVANRAGEVGGWRERPELGAAVAGIEATCGALLARLGYALDASADPGPLVGPAILQFLGLDALLPAAVAAEREGDPLLDPRLPLLLAEAGRLTEARLADAGLSPGDAQALLRNLGTFAAAHQERLASHLEALGGRFAGGSAQHMDKLRALLRRSREAP